MCEISEAIRYPLRSNKAPKYLRYTVPPAEATTRIVSAMAQLLVVESRFRKLTSRLVWLWGLKEAAYDGSAASLLSRAVLTAGRELQPRNAYSC